MKLYFFIFTALIFLSLSSCKKEDNFEDIDIPIEEQDVTCLYHEISALNAIKELFISGQQLAFTETNFVFNTLSNGCAINKDSISSKDSMKLNLNFGNQISLSKDGKFRSGVVEYVYSKNKSFCDSGNVIKLFLKNYRVDSLLINGIQTLKNNGKVNDTMSWGITSTLLITNNKSKSFSYNGNHFILLNNYSSSFIDYKHSLNFDYAIFKLRGSAFGKNIVEETYSSTLNNNVEFSLLCKADNNFQTNSQFIKGAVLYQTKSLFSQKNSIIDFGIGICDSKVTLKSKGYSIETTYK